MAVRGSCRSSRASVAALSASAEPQIEREPCCSEFHKQNCEQHPISCDGRKQNCEQHPISCKGHKFCQLFGFELDDLTSWKRFVYLLSRPSDPACLGFTRFIFGLLMVLDTLQERGMAAADFRWGDPEECRFPLFDFLQPLPVQWMCVIYFVMLLGAAGIMLGAAFRFSCLAFLLPYWYILLLDKSSWNNHSYLFGILAFLLLLSDANRYWSLDSFFSSRLRNADVPLWNYTLLRTQVFLVYFLAGLKKLDIDWVSGYSMENLAQHWVFDPFRLVMNTSQVDYFVVHLGGLTIDLFIGFLLFFDKTRLFGFLICSSFHLMNSQLFSIGMFPWAMLATQPLFCHADWPRHIFQHIPRVMRVFTPDEDDDEAQVSSHCLYSKAQAKPENTEDSTKIEPPPKQIPPPVNMSVHHCLAAVFTLAFIAWQVFLPYSHFITKGYNSWTQGLYGYSWDMMVHSRSLQHVRITFVDKETGHQGYLNPDMWSKTWRWGSHPDMVKQYARCIASNLRKHNVNKVELYFDVWISLNRRFQQRTVDPRVDILTAEWSAFQPTPWMMPLLVDLSDWRGKFAEIEESLHNSTQLLDVVFVADFPGLQLENYVHADIGNASISVLKGSTIVEILQDDENDKFYANVTLTEGQSMQIPAGRFHTVHTVSTEPSCYMYVYVNTTEVRFLEGLKEFELSLNGSMVDSVPEKFAKDPMLDHYRRLLSEKQKEQKIHERPLWERATGFLKLKYDMAVRSMYLIRGALLSIFTSKPFHVYLQEIISTETQQLKQS